LFNERYSIPLTKGINRSGKKEKLVQNIYEKEKRKSELFHMSIKDVKKFVSSDDPSAVEEHERFHLEELRKEILLRLQAVGINYDRFKFGKFPRTVFKKVVGTRGLRIEGKRSFVELSKKRRERKTIHVFNACERDEFPDLNGNYMKRKYKIKESPYLSNGIMVKPPPHKWKLALEKLTFHYLWTTQDLYVTMTWRRLGWSYMDDKWMAK
jgi:hypothetical protein